MEKVLVLGATGNIGRALLGKLQAHNIDVYAGYRQENAVEPIKTLGAKPLQVDFTNRESLNHALKGIHRVFLVTPLMQHPEKITQLVLEACRENNVHHLVRSTALGADSHGAIQMARWAGKSEDLMLASGIKYTIIRPNNFLQNFINFHAHTIKEQQAFYMPNGDAKLGMVDVNDIAEVAVLALTSDKHFNKVYNLSGLALTNHEYANLLSETLERTISYVDVSEEQAQKSLLDSGVPKWMTDAMMELNYIMKQGWTAAYSEDYSTITGKEYTSAETFFTANKDAFL